MDNSPFYAYITCASPSSTTLILPRSVMVFSNSGIADEWWRFVSAAHTSESYSGSSNDLPGSANFSSCLAYLLEDKDFAITRTSAQLYICKSKFSNGHGLIDRIFQLKPICEKFEGKLFVGPEGMISSLVPSKTLTEHISGNW
ncbi:hypothetical protein BDP27DRAFT_1425300 [Rhodocollybia butyracea]|uniref:Uncharacterized protein n=1 Tax=Rhodocollybia butyracea TaxID=206335 RepID=A0A9P5PK84_9AGAR|nr:hypothetical protein BDP27DRAFT_1425300 [Rhodocollybia butyracea]